MIKRRLLPSLRITIRKRGLYFLTRFLKYLFKPVAVIPLLFTIFSLHTLIYLLPGNTSIFAGISGIPSSSYLLALLMIIFSIIIHEMGHLSACHYLGCSYKGLQFYWPNIFKGWGVNITNVWMLNPKKRVIIDLGGIWFQLLLCAFIFILYLVSGNKLLILTIFLIDIQLIWGIIPYKKSDGYWLIIDLCDIPEQKFAKKQIFNNSHSKQSHSLLRETLDSLPSRSRRNMKFFIIVLNILLLGISTLLFIVALKLSNFLIREWAVRLYFALGNKELLIIISRLFLIFFWIMVLFTLMLCFWRLVKFVLAFYFPRIKSMMTA